MNGGAGTIRAIKDGLGTVADVLDQHGVEVRGKVFRCIMPGHDDKNPSASLYDDGLRWKCHACHGGGDAIDAYAALHGLELEAAIAELKSRFGIDGNGRGRGKLTPRPKRTADEKLIESMPSVSRALGAVSGPVSGLELNYEIQKIQTDEGEIVRSIARSFDETVRRVQDMTQGTLARVGELVFSAPAMRGEPVRWFNNATDLFAHLGTLNKTIIDWKSNMRGAMTKAEAFSELASRLYVYESIETAPHYPTMPGRFYNHPELPEPDQAALDDLVNEFCPETDHDRVLIVALLATSIWGGGEGQRPAFIITSPDGRGAGKSTVPEVAAYLLNQSPVSGSSKQDMEQLKTRMLSPAGLTSRIVIFDNEVGRVSSGELAGLITARTISGRQLYVGEGRRPNTMLWCVTLNTPSLDTDLAQRGIPISVRRPDYDPEWLNRVFGLIDAKRWSIIAALVALLRLPGVAAPTVSRWGAWEAQVLCRLAKWCRDWNGLLGLIRERQQAFDDEAGEIELIRDGLTAAIARASLDATTDQCFIPNALAADAYNHATGAHVRKNTALRSLRELIRTQSIPELQEHRHPAWGRGFLWATGEALSGDGPIRLVDPNGHNPWG